MYINGIEVDSVRTVYVNASTGDCSAYIGSPPPVITGDETEPYKPSTTLKWNLASYYLFGDTVTAAGVSALHAVGPHYCGEFHGTNSVGSYLGSRAVLAVAAAVKYASGDKDAIVDGAEVQLPPASKLIVALNAGLATRVHNTSAPASGNNKFWQRDSDNNGRDHRRDRGPDTTYDKVSSIQVRAQLADVV